MIAQSEVIPTTSTAVSTWQTLNEATQAMKKARSVSRIIRVLAEFLHKAGYQVIVSELNSERDTARIKYIIGPSVATSELAKFWPALKGRRLSLASLSLPSPVLQNGQIEFVRFKRESLDEIVGPDLAVNRDLVFPNHKAELSGIIAPISADWHWPQSQSYLIFLYRPQISADDNPLILTFVNIASMMIGHKHLAQEAHRQRQNAETLREVSRIISSSLNPETVLNSILEELSKVIPYDSAAIHLETKGYLKLEAGRGFEHDQPVLDIAVPVESNSLYQEMKYTGKPIVINDVRQDSRYTFWAGTNPIRSWIGVPLSLQNEIIGQISIDSFKKNALTQADEELAFAFAQQVATAIQNARLFEKVTQIAHELEALLDGAKDVGSSLDPERVMYLMASRLLELMQANVVVYLLNASGEGLHPVVMLETQLDQATATAMQVNQRLANRAMIAKRGLIENRPAQFDLPVGEDNLPATAMATPFLVQDRAIGAITLSRDNEPLFTRDDLDLVTRFALQTGIAVENSRLYKQLERRLYRENLLNKLSRRMSSKLGLTDLAKDILTTAQSIARADLAGLILKDPADKSRYVSYLQDASDLSLSRIAKRPGLAIASIREKRIILTDDYESEAYPGPRWIPQRAKGAISMPITIGNRVLGALGLFALEAPFAQSDEILATLESIGWQTGVAIENALLFQQVNEYAQTLQEKVEERTAEIQKQKEQTDAILESAADAIFITSADGSIDYVNPAFSTLTGYAPEQVIGRSFEVLISGQTSTKKYQRMWNAILAGKTWRGDVKCKRYDDSLYDADLTIACIFNIHGRIDKFVAIQRDISKKTELDRLKSEFLVTASHELRTPLTNVIGYTELLLNRSFSQEETTHFLRYIYDQSKHLANLVSDLLDVSKIESGTAVVVSPKLINPGHIFTEIVDYWQGVATRHDIQLEQPKMWPDIKADPDRLKQVLNNLLSNAVKYSPNGGKVSVVVRLNPGNLHIIIKDEGIGMTMDEQKHLFEKFWRADASAIAIEGTGLGMVIVKHIIESHGGKIWVSSRKEAGTKVNFTLPLLDSAPTILVVEDDPSIIEIMGRLLRMEEYHVLTASTGLAGLKTAISEHPDLIILDLMLPELEGEDLLRRLKETPATANIPVVVVSAKSALTNIEYVFTLGAADFLTKPFDFDELLSRIRIALLSKGNS